MKVHNIISPLQQLEKRGHDLLGNGPAYVWLSAFLAFVVTFAGFWVLKWALDQIGTRVFQHTRTTIDDELLRIVSRRVLIFGAIVSIYAFIRQVTSGVAIEDHTFRSGVAWLNAFLYIGGAIVLVSIVVRATSLLVRHALARRDASSLSPEDRANGSMSLQNALAPLVARVLNFALVLVALIVVLQHFGQNISTLVVSLGVGSLAVALAAQDTLSNMIAGFMILIDRPFRVGDRIMIPSGEVGDVYEIGVRSSKILDFNNNLLIVPNNELVKTRIVNYSYPASIVRCVVTVGVAYGSDVDAVKALLLGVAQSNPEVLSEPAPDVRLMELGESSLDMRLTVYVSNFQAQFDTTEKLRVEAYKALGRAGIEIPFPQRDVHIRNT